MRRLRAVGTWLAAGLALWAVLAVAAVRVSSQVTIPNSFTTNTTADPDAVNTNFSTLGTQALNRTGGTMTGTLSSQAIAPVVDATYAVGSAILRYTNAFFSGTVTAGTFAGTNATLSDITLTSPATGLTVAGINIINNTGKIPALSSIYLSDLSGANLTGLVNLNASALSAGTVPMARLTAGTFTRVTTTSTGTLNDFAPGLSGDTLVVFNNATLATVTGFAAGVDGQLLVLVSTGAGRVDLPHQNTGSAAASRLLNMATSAATSLAPGAGTAVYIYDTGNARWRLIVHDQGDFLTGTFNAADYVASTAGTWTVAAGDVKDVSYWLRGRSLLINVSIETTTIVQSGGQPTALTIANPEWGGFTLKTAAKQVTASYLADNGTGGGGFLQASQALSSTLLYVGRFNAVQFSAATDATAVWGQIMVAVN
jgi:hypothetical protein